MRHSKCRNCGHAISGNYCSNCGDKASIKAITLSNIFHEVFHYFTHLDKGFGYTLKKLITSPGTMQRKYIEGERARHQKPFSMFFICGTVSGLGYYLINVAFRKLYGEADYASEDFFRHYFVLLQAVLVPFYTLFTWLCFKNNRYNYAETLIMLLYNLSLVFLVLVPIVSFNLIFPNYENRIVELIFILLYNSFTNLNFYRGKKAIIILQTVVAIAACYLCSQVVSELTREWLN
ncbi:MAG TPA: DUF3667 domain-containing protein [Segetibacter sp.]|jgi:hypothetical protein